MNLKKFLAFLCTAVAALSGCSSPPEPPQPSGERIAINHLPEQPVPQPALAHSVLVDDAATLHPQIIEPQPQPQQVPAVDPTEFDRLNYRK